MLNSISKCLAISAINPFEATFSGKLKRIFIPSPSTSASPKKPLITSLGHKNSSSMLPCSTILPPSMSTARFAVLFIASISCVTSTIVMPSSRFIRFKSSKICLVVFGSSALVASSLSSIFGLSARALAIAMRCFCPPLSWFG